jgi:hypothetical protein
MPDRPGEPFVDGAPMGGNVLVPEIFRAHRVYLMAPRCNLPACTHRPTWLGAGAQGDVCQALDGRRRCRI